MTNEASFWDNGIIVLVWGMGSLAVKIKLRDKEIVFEDIINITEEQTQLILTEAKKKTEKQWLNPDTKGIKVRLSLEQKADVLKYKNQIVDSHTAETLIQDRRLRFTDHGLKRIATRIDRDNFPSEKSLLGVADVIIHSQDVETDAEWRGYGRLSYNFNGEYEGKACKVTVVFDGPILVITVITDETTPAMYTMSTILPADVMAKLATMRNSPKRKPRRGRRK